VGPTVQADPSRASSGGKRVTAAAPFLSRPFLPPALLFLYGIGEDSSRFVWLMADTDLF
jgi:hypothetical protein